MKRSQPLSQGSLNRSVQEARTAWNEGDYEKCFDLLERVCRMDPANIPVLLNLGQCYGARWRYADAERCLDKAVRVSPSKADALVIAGRLASGFNQTQMAERYFQQAASLPAATAEIFAHLAELNERLHRPKDAMGMVDKALQMDSHCALARLVQSRLHRQAGRLTDAEVTLTPILNTASRDLRVKGHYELGTIHDRQGRFDDAMSAFGTAKLLLQPDAPPLVAQLQSIVRYLNEMRDNVSAELLKRWAGSSTEFLNSPQRLAFLGGHARSGTTLLEQVLDSHADIVSAEETTIFNDDAFVPLQHALPRGISLLQTLDQASVPLLRKGRERYFHSMTASLGQPPAKRLLIDKNPSLQNLIISFVRFFPEAKLLVALRDPRDVVLSCFMLPHVPPTVASVNYLDLGNTVDAYCRTMGIWQTIKPMLQNPWLEVRYEDMVEDLESVARKSLAFLGVPWDSKVLGFDEHARKKLVRSPTYADVTQKVYTRAKGRWRNYQKYLEPHLEKLEPFVKAFGYG